MPRMNEPENTLSPRAERFARRLRGEREPTFGDLIRQAQASRQVHTGDDRVPAALALLQAKPALDRELSGARLQHLANLLGDDLLDAVRESHVSEIAPDVLVSFLPPPSAIVPQGLSLLERVSENTQIAHLAQLAMDLVRGSEVAA